MHVALLAFALTAPVPKTEPGNSKGTLAVLAELGLTDAFGRLADVPDRYDVTADELKAVRDNPEEHPLRAVILKAGEIIAATHKVKLPTEFKATDLDSAKAAIQPYRKDVAVRILEMEEAYEGLVALRSRAMKETHPRWKAQYEFLCGYLLVEIAKAHEYNTLLGHLITENVPEGILAEGVAGLRLAADDKIRSRKAVRDCATCGREALAIVAKDHRGTPWGDLAAKMAEQPCGLKWEAVKAGK